MATEEYEHETDTDEYDESSTEDEQSSDYDDELLDYEEFEDFAPFVKGIDDFEPRTREFLNSSYDEAEASVRLEKALVNTEKIKAEVRTYLCERRETIDKIKRGDPNSAKVWQMQHQLQQKGLALRFKCSLLAEGLTMDAIYNTADDANHIVEDSLSPDDGKQRKSNRDKMKKLTPSERQKVLERWWNENEHDDDEYDALAREYL